MWATDCTLTHTTRFESGGGNCDGSCGTLGSCPQAEGEAVEAWYRGARSTKVCVSFPLDEDHVEG